MNIGILIIFSNNEKEINNTLLNGLLTIQEQSLICLVNNASKDETLEKLLTFKESLPNINIIDIKINKGNKAAIKAGVRFLCNQKELQHIGFLNFEKMGSLKNLNKIIQAVKMNKELITHYNLKEQIDKQTQRSLLKNVFSIVEYLNSVHFDFDKVELNAITS